MQSCIRTIYRLNIKVTKPAASVMKLIRKLKVKCCCLDETTFGLPVGCSVSKQPSVVCAQFVNGGAPCSSHVNQPLELH